MKKLLIVLLLAMAMLLPMFKFAPQPFAQIAPKLNADATATVFCRTTNLNAINVGNGFLVSCNLSNLQTVLQKCGNVDGISICFCGDQNAFYAVLSKLSARVNTCQKLNDLTVICAYSSQIRGGVMLQGQLTNLQIAFDGQTVTVGSPLILDSF